MHEKKLKLNFCTENGLVRQNYMLCSKPCAFEKSVTDIRICDFRGKKLCKKYYIFHSHIRYFCSHLKRNIVQIVFINIRMADNKIPLAHTMVISTKSIRIPN